MNDRFSQVRKLVSAEDAAHHYGLQFDRMERRCLCPFHDDHHPSMTFHNGRFRCWACGVSGSSIDLVMGLFGLSEVEALNKLIADFQLALPLTSSQARESNQQRLDREWEKAVESALIDWIGTETDRLADWYHIGHDALKGISEPDDIDRLTNEQVRAVQEMPQSVWTADALYSGDADRIMDVLGVTV